jgi:hypothetical protein
VPLSIKPNVGYGAILLMAIIYRFLFYRGFIGWMEMKTEEYQVIYEIK